MCSSSRHRPLHVSRKLRCLVPTSKECVLAVWTCHQEMCAGRYKDVVHPHNHGHHLTCSTSHFKVQMQQQSKPSACHLAGKYRTCKWSGAADETGALTTCVAECQCQGDDCKQLVVHIPKLYEDWKICEINIK